jgi:hypothetical protein
MSKKNPKNIGKHFRVFGYFSAMQVQKHYKKGFEKIRAE